jgi:hypothetical protein
MCGVDRDRAAVASETLGTQGRLPGGNAPRTVRGGTGLRAEQTHAQKGPVRRGPVGRCRAGPRRRRHAGAMRRACGGANQGGARGGRVAGLVRAAGVGRQGWPEQETNKAGKLQLWAACFSVLTGLPSARNRGSVSAAFQAGAARGAKGRCILPRAAAVCARALGSRFRIVEWLRGEGWAAGLGAPRAANLKHKRTAARRLPRRRVTAARSAAAGSRI